jgi:hypothetical protein
MSFIDDKQEDILLNTHPTRKQLLLGRMDPKDIHFKSRSIKVKEHFDRIHNLLGTVDKVHHKVKKPKMPKIDRERIGQFQ